MVKEYYLKKIEEMIKKQIELNNHTCGDKWVLGKTDKDRQIRWKTAILVECGELIESFNWKHWKDIEDEDDITNAKVELVDILHFLISLAISHGVSIEDLRDTIYNSFLHVIDNYRNKLDTSIFERVNYFVSEVLWFDTDPTNMFNSYAFVCDAIDLNLKDIIKIYFGKNILNKFRQDHGYKEGKYKKRWLVEMGGKLIEVEDNEYMIYIIDFINDVEGELYKQLEDVYVTQ